MVGAVLEGQLLARLADAPELTASAITFESEARSRPGRGAEKGAEAPLPEEAPLDEPLLEEQTEQEADASRGRDRRRWRAVRRGRGGTRGRRRGKKAPTAEQPEVGEEPLAARQACRAGRTGAGKRRRPKIHVPPEDESNGDSATAEPAPAVADDPEAAANGQPEAPKKTRRGTSRRAQAQEAGGRLRGNRRDARWTVVRQSRSQRTGVMSRCPVARRLRPTPARRRAAANIPRLAGACPRFHVQFSTAMSYAIISIGGKQYRVREGERCSSTASTPRTARRSRPCSSSAATVSRSSRPAM